MKVYFFGVWCGILLSIGAAVLWHFRAEVQQWGARVAARYSRKHIPVDSGTGESEKGKSVGNALQTDGSPKV